MLVELPELQELPEDWGRMVRDGVLHVSAELR